MSANYKQYDESRAKYQDLQNRYNELDKKLNAEMETYKQKANELTGEKGLDKAFNKGTELAQKTAGQAVTQAQTSARQAGMSKAAAAMMGANQSANTYADTLQASTNQAYSANQDELNAQNKAIDVAQGNIGNNDTRVGQQANLMASDKAVAEAKQDQIYKGIGTGLQVAGQVAQIGAMAASDERLKKIFGEKDCDRVIDLMSKINAIEFVYTDGAQDKYDGSMNVDDDTHVGVSAQELEKNPLTQAAVEEVNGDKMVNTAELTTINTASISALAKEIKELKDMVWQLQHQEDDAHNRPRKPYTEEEHDKVINHVAEVLHEQGSLF